MHDFYDILGVPRGARAPDIIRAYRARLSRPHPDFHDGDVVAETSMTSAAGRAGAAGPAGSVTPGSLGSGEPQGDIALDFAHMRHIVDRMRAAFFGSGS